MGPKQNAIARDEIPSAPFGRDFFASKSSFVHDKPEIVRGMDAFWGVSSMALGRAANAPRKKDIPMSTKFTAANVRHLFNLYATQARDLATSFLGCPVVADRVMRTALLSLRGETIADMGTGEELPQVIVTAVRRLCEDAFEEACERPWEEEDVAA